MISNFSMPVNSFIATASVGISVKKKRNDSTVRPRAIEIGMPVSISSSRIANTMPVLPSMAIAPSAAAIQSSHFVAFCLENCSHPATVVVLI